MVKMKRGGKESKSATQKRVKVERRRLEERKNVKGSDESAKVERSSNM